MTATTRQRFLGAVVVALLAATGAVSAQQQYAGENYTVTVQPTTTGAQVTLVVTPPPPPDPGVSSTPTPITGPLVVYGDSIAAGVGGSPGFASRVGTSTGCGVNIRALSGAQALEVAIQTYGAEVFSASRVLLYAVGINDARIYGANQDRIEAMAGAEMESLAWLTIPASMRVTGRSGAMTRLGSTWGDTAVFGLGIRTLATDESLTATVSGTAVYVGYIQQDGVIAQAVVTVDGQQRGVFGTNVGGPIVTQNGSTYGPRVLRIGGLPAGSHTVTVRATYADSANPIYIDWIAGVPGTPITTAPTVLVASTVNGAVAPNAVSLVNAYIAKAVADLRADGLPVVLVDAGATFDAINGMGGDGVHPNNIGHASIAAAFVAALNGRRCP